MTKNITLIGTDSTHCTAFSRILQSSASAWQVRYGVRDCRSQLAVSTSRRLQIERQLEQELGVVIVDNLTDELLEKTDGFIVTGVDAALHLSQFQQLVKAGKPVFIDKPLAYSPEVAKEIYQAGADTGTAFFSSSSLRFSESVCQLKQQIASNESWQGELTGPIVFEKGIPGFYWYGIHLVELLLTLFPKTFQVEAVQMNQLEKRVTIHLTADRCQICLKGDLTGVADFSAELSSNQQKLAMKIAEDSRPLYAYLLEKIIHFFETGEPPISFEQTLAVLELTETINLYLKGVPAYDPLPESK